MGLGFQLTYRGLDTVLRVGVLPVQAVQPAVHARDEPTEEIGRRAAELAFDGMELLAGRVGAAGAATVLGKEQADGGDAVPRKAPRLRVGFPEQPFRRVALGRSAGRLQSDGGQPRGELRHLDVRARAGDAFQGPLEDGGGLLVPAFPLVRLPLPGEGFRDGPRVAEPLEERECLVGVAAAEELARSRRVKARSQGSPWVRASATIASTAWSNPLNPPVSRRAKYQTEPGCRVFAQAPCRTRRPPGAGMPRSRGC